MRKILLLLLVLFSANVASARFTVTVPAEWKGRKILFKATERSEERRVGKECY